MISQRGDEKFSWGEPTEAKNPKKNFSKGPSPFSRSGKRGVVSRSDEFADRIQHIVFDFKNRFIGAEGKYRSHFNR